MTNQSPTESKSVKLYISMCLQTIFEICVILVMVLAVGISTTDRQTEWQLLNLGSIPGEGTHTCI